MTPRERLLRDKASLDALVERNRAERGAPPTRAYLVTLLLPTVPGHLNQNDVAREIERGLASVGLRWAEGVVTPLKGGGE